MVVHPAASNDQIDWDRLDVASYLADNYRELRDDDQAIIERMTQFFDEAVDHDKLPYPRAVDVGTGSNLYPALAMLPFAERVDLREVSTTSVGWLQGQLADGFDATWDPFWQRMCGRVTYKEYFTDRDVREDLSAKAEATVGSVFGLPRATWNLGTMFFTACSLSTDDREFRRALRRFVDSLVTGAPFVVASMINSSGYEVDGAWFPAVKLTESDIQRGLSKHADHVKVYPIHSEQPVRPGIHMALATGFAR